MSINDMALIIQSPRAYDGIFVPSGLTGAAVQDAIDAARAAGGGTVWLGNNNYSVSSTINLDNGLVALRGTHANLDGSGMTSGPVLKVTMLEKVDTTSLFMGGFTIAGPGSGSSVDGILFSTAPGVDDKNCQYTARDILVYNCRYGWQLSDGAYLIRIRDCAAVSCNTGINTDSGASNAGENISWIGGTISGNYLAIGNAKGMELNFTDVSVDYNTLCYWGQGDATFNNCHFEQNRQSGSTNRPFQSAYGRLLFNGGSFTWAGGAPATTPDYFFYTSDSSGRVIVNYSRFYQVYGATAVQGPYGTFTDNHV